MVRWVRAGAVAFFLLFVVAVTWPGMTPFNTVEPLVLGLPFSMTWIALWVLLSFVVLVVVDRVEEGAREGEAERGPGESPGEGKSDSLQDRDDPSPGEKV